MRETRLGLAAVVLAAGGCGGATDGSPEATPATDSQPDGLAGSAWQLVRIQSMDDTVQEPDERGKYTLQFGDDGTVAIRADCNRGTGGWTSEGSSLAFGPLATTRAMCPPGSLHDAYITQLSYVRSYVLRDGMLHLATMADGAIIDFEPLPDAN